MDMRDALIEIVFLLRDIKKSLDKPPPIKHKDIIVDESK